MASVRQCPARSVSAIAAALLGMSTAHAADVGGGSGAPGGVSGGQAASGVARRVGSALATDSGVRAHVDTRLAHTDNVTLAPAGSEVSENLADVRAGFDFARYKPRLNAQVAYEATGVFYDHASDANEIFNTLDANAQLVLVLERLFLDTFAMYDQTVVDATGKGSFNKLALSGNRTDVAIYGASPHVALNVGQNAVGEVRYSDTRVNYDDPTLRDNRERYATFTLGNSGSRKGPSWSVYYNREQFDYGRDSPIEFQNFELNLGHLVGPTVRLFTIQGLESDYTLVVANGPSATTPAPGLDKHYWYVGADWQPSDRSRATVSVGEREFGRAYDLQWSYRAPRGGINLDYSEQPSSFLRGQLDNARQAGQFTPIDSLDGPNGNRFYLQKRASVTFVVDRPRSSAALRFFNDRRFDIVAATNDEEKETENYSAAELTLTWSVTPVASVGLSSQLANRRSTLNVVDDELRYTAFRFSRKLGRQGQLTASLSRERERPKGGGGLNDYEENQISVGLERRFGAKSGAGNVPQRFNGFLNATSGR